MTRILRVSWLWLAVAAGLLLASPGGAASPGAEQRCRELGSGCLCSEPLDVNDGSLANHRHHDPTDSPDATECKGENGTGQAVTFFGSSTGNTVAPDAEGIPFPSGAQVGYVWRKNDTGISHMGGNTVEVSNTSVCIRSYQRIHRDFNAPFDSDGTRRRFKVQTLGGKGFYDSSGFPGLNYQWSTYNGGNGGSDQPFKINLVSSHWGIDEGMTTRTVQWKQCQDYWCRFELCADHRSDGRVLFRSRVTMLSDPPVTENMDSHLSPASHPTLQLGLVKVASLFTSNTTGTQRRYFSYGMMAKRSPASSSFWIGPAAEIEGGLQEPLPAPDPGPDPAPEPDPQPQPDPAPEPVPSPDPVAGQLVTVSSVVGGGNYAVRVGLENGARIFSDRSYTYSGVPGELLGANYVQTENDDKSSSGGAWLTLEALEPVTVYVAHDDGVVPKPAWLAGFADTGLAIPVNTQPHSLYAKSFAAGPVILGGNQSSSSSGGSMYFVIVVPEDAGSATPELGMPGKPFLLP